MHCMNREFQSGYIWRHPWITQTWEALFVVHKLEPNHKNVEWNSYLHQTEVLIWCNIFDLYTHVICMWKKNLQLSLMKNSSTLFYHSWTQFSAMFETLIRAKSLLDFWKTPEYLSWGHSSAWGTQLCATACVWVTKWDFQLQNIVFLV